MAEPFKLIVLGDSGVGKSSIIVQQVSDLFLEDHGFTFEPTLEDIYKKQIIVGEEIFALEIVDTSGREDIRSDLNLDEKYLEEGEGFMLVFDINDPKTFISVLLYRERIIRLNSNKRVPIVFIANKCDVCQSAGSTHYYKKHAKYYGIPVIKTSAKTSLGIEVAFRTLIEETKRKRKFTKSPSDPCLTRQYSLKTESRRFAKHLGQEIIK